MMTDNVNIAVMGYKFDADSHASATITITYVVRMSPHRVTPEILLQIYNRLFELSEEPIEIEAN